MRFSASFAIIPCLVLAAATAWAQQRPGRPLPEPRPGSSAEARPGTPPTDRGAPAPNARPGSAPAADARQPPAATPAKPAPAAATGPVQCGTPAWQPFRQAVDAWCAKQKKKNAWCPDLTRLYRDCKFTTDAGEDIEAAALQAAVIGKGKFTEDIGIRNGILLHLGFAKVKDVWMVQKLKQSYYE